MSALLEPLMEQREKIKVQLAQLGDMRPGSLVARYLKCSKPSCHCAKEGDPGHGPYWSITHEVDGKTVTKAIPSGPSVEYTKAQIAEFKRFRNLAKELVQVNEQICNTKLLQPQAEAEATAKKGASKPVSRRKSPRNSKTF